MPAEESEDFEKELFTLTMATTTTITATEMKTTTAKLLGSMARMHRTTFRFTAGTLPCGAGTCHACVTRTSVQCGDG